MQARGLGPRETVGRRRELAEIDHALRRAGSAQSTGLVITGSAGLGKSRLLDHLMVAGMDHGFTVRLLRCGDEVDDLDRLWAELVATPTARRRQATRALDDEAVAMDRIMTRRAHELSLLVDALIEQAGDPLVLAIDDIHWASPLLTGLLHQLTHRLRENPMLPLLLAIGARPMPRDTHNARAVADLISFNGCIALDLEPLNAAEEAELIRQDVGVVTPTFIGVVRSASGGNPLRSLAIVGLLGQMGVHTTIEAGDEAGALRLDVTSVGDDPVTTWLAGQPPAVLSVLRIGAVLGGGFDIDDVVRVAAEPELDGQAVAEALDRAAALEVLASDGSRYWFTHHLFQEAADTLTPGPQRRELNRRRAAALLESATADDGRAWLAIGRHLLQAGDGTQPVVDPVVLVRAGRAAMDLGRWFESAQLLRRALSERAEAGLGPGDRASALHLCGVAHFFDHDLKGAVEVLTEAASLAEELGDHDLWGSVLWTRLAAINNLDPEAYRRPTDLAEYLDVVERLDHPAHQARLLHACAETYITAGMLDEGRTIAERASDLASQGADRPTRAMCAYAVGYADLTAGRVRSAFPALREAVRLARGSGDWFVESALVGRLAFAHLGVGDLDRAQDAAEQSMAQAVAHSEHSNQALGGSILATVGVLTGDLRLAVAHLHEARLATERSSYRGADMFLGPVEVLVALYDGDHDGAVEALEHWPALPGVLRRGFERLVSAHRSPASALSSPALPRWRDNQVSIAAMTIDLQATLLMGDRVRLGQLDELVEPLRQEEVSLPPMAPFALGRLLGELDLAVGRPEDAKRLLDRTAERLRACGALTELALTDLARSAVAAELGSPADEVERMRTSGAQLLERIGIAWPSRAPTPLSDGAEPGPTGAADPGEWTVILVTDVVGSTEISARFGDLAYYDLIMAHHELVREACRPHGGHETGDSGDGLYFWFTDTDDALAAALAIQEAVTHHRRAAGPALAVKISLAGGAPIFRGQRPYGLVLNRAFRVADTARPGQVVLDEAVAAAVAPSRIAERFERELRGIGMQTISILHTGNDRSVSEEAMAGSGTDNGEQ